jgi:hypothetical protein
MINTKLNYDELLENMSMGDNLENGIYTCTDGIMIISGDSGEEIDFVEFR